MNIFDNNKKIIDPFAGKYDLLNLFDNSYKKIGYDLDPKNDLTIKQNTLTSPPNYAGSFVITNPPYLAKNKNKDKSLYIKYNTDDLYKAAMLSIIGCEGGVIIVPLNFFSSEDDKIRQKFLSKYEVKRVNVFEQTVFSDTSYTVCAFSFIKRKNIKQNIDFFFFPSGDLLQLNLTHDRGYRIGYDVYNLKESNVKVSRLLIGQDALNSKVFLYAIDTGTEIGKIKLSLKEPFYGKSTDRAFETMVFNKNFTIDKQKFIVNEFNKVVNLYRKKYKSMFLTNYRNSTKTLARKRIGFRLAHRIVSNIIFENKL